MICGGTSCPDPYICVEAFTNPNYGIIAFDNIFISIVVIFQCITMEGWTRIMYMVGGYICICMHVCIDAWFSFLFFVSNVLSFALFSYKRMHTRTHIYTQIEDAFHWIGCLYFISLVLLCSFFVINLMLAVLKSNFAFEQAEIEDREIQSQVCVCVYVCVCVCVCVCMCVYMF